MKKIILIFLALVFLSFTDKRVSAQIYDWNWAKNALGDKSDRATGICADGNGSIFITGWFKSSAISFGTHTLFNAGDNDTTDVYIAKYDASGNVLWAKSAGGPGWDEGYGIVADKSGNVYITGLFTSDTIVFGNDTLIKGTMDNGDIFVVKYDSMGNVCWAKKAYGSFYAIGMGIAVDRNDNIYITGAFALPYVIFGNDTLINLATHDIYDFFVAKYDQAGNILWVRNQDGEGGGFEEGRSIATDNTGNVYITGVFASSLLTFGDTTLVNADNIGGEDIFIVKYDSSGSVLWAGSVAGSDENDGSYGITTAEDGSMYLTGYFKSHSIALDSMVLTNSGFPEAAVFIAKYNRYGKVSWAHSISGSYDNCAQAITADSSGNAYITGWFKSPALTFGSHVLSNVYPGYADIFIAKYDSSGNPVWAKSTGGYSSDWSNSMCTDKSGNIYISGVFNSLSMTMGNTVLSNSGYEDIFIARLSSAATEIHDTLVTENKFEVFPNPAGNSIEVVTNQKSVITIFNGEGQIIKTMHTDDGESTIDLENLPKGIYLIKAETIKGIMIKKIIKV